MKKIRVRDPNKLSIQHHVKMYIRDHEIFEKITERAQELDVSLSSYLKMCVAKDLEIEDKIK